MTRREVCLWLAGILAGLLMGFGLGLSEGAASARDAARREAMEWLETCGGSPCGRWVEMADGSVEFVFGGRCGEER